MNTTAGAARVLKTETIALVNTVMRRNEMSSDDLQAVQLYYVIGIGGTYYGTKMQAEAEARKAFPDEGADKRYARIYYKTFYQEV
jgi:hypothetical protein